MARLCGGVAALATDASAGDLRLAGSPRPSRTPNRHRELVDREWAIPRQVHGARVVVLETSRGPLDVEADAVVSATSDACVAVLGADCGLVGLASPEGLFGVAHAGWRGLDAGVIEATVKALGDLGASRL
ncbi:MAG: hypothetical protein JWM85_2205, partial [Acidimicrobiaceae bacterium]|nr:hypothetical protein [Acidimicrobiaceae bacterium]